MKRRTPEQRAKALAKWSATIKRRTSEQRAKIWAKKSAAAKRHIEMCDGTCGRATCSPVRSPTRIEDALVDVLLAEFPEVIRERKFGPYRVDAYIPAPYHLAFEADGAYWHSLPGRAVKDAGRDAYLLAEHGLLVIRLGEAELLAIGTA